MRPQSCLLRGPLAGCASAAFAGRSSTYPGYACGRPRSASPARSAIGSLATASFRPHPLGLLLLLWTLPAGAHTLPIRHRVLATARLEAGRLRADVLLWMQLPAGEHVEQLMARYDLNRDGRLAEAEGAMLADDLGPEVVGSFVLRAGGISARPLDAKSSARIEPDGGMSVVVLLSYELGAPDAVLALVLREGAPPPREGHERQYTGEWAVLPPLALRETNGPPDPDGRAAGPVPLQPGGPGLEITVSLAPPAPLLP